MKHISEELVTKTRSWLGEEGFSFFMGECYKKYGTVSPVFMYYGVPHPVHFREGMTVRNFMRGTGLCVDWDAHDFDNNWCEVVERAIGVKKW